MLTQLRVLTVEANGQSVAGDAVTSVAIERPFAVRIAGPSTEEENLSTFDTSVPFTILRGPRISIAGGLDSPHNALKVVLLLSIRPGVPAGNWTINLKLQGSETDSSASL